MIFAFGWEKRTCVGKKIERNEENKHSGHTKEKQFTSITYSSGEHQKGTGAEEAGRGGTNQSRETFAFSDVAALVVGGQGFDLGCFEIVRTEDRHEKVYLQVRDQE